MLPAAAVSVKSAARWSIFVRRPGVHMACVEGGRGGLYIASGDHEGRHGGTRVNQRRGQVQNQRGGAFVRFAPFGGRAFTWHACVTQCEGTEAFASRRGGREGRAGHGRTSAGAGRTRRALAVYREQTAAGCAAVFGTFTLGVKAAGASALRREFALRGDIHNRRADGKPARVGGKSSGRLPTRSHGARAGAEVSHHVGAGAGMKLAAQRAKAVRLAPSRSHRAEVRRGRFHRADAVVKATGASSLGASHGVCTFSFTFASAVTARISTARFLVSAGDELFDRTWAAWGAGEVGAVCGRTGLGGAKATVGAQEKMRKEKNGLGLKLETAQRTGGPDRLLDGKGFGAMAYIEDGDPPIACKIRCREKEWRGLMFICDPIGYPLRKVAAPLYVTDLERGGGGRQEASPWRAVTAVVTPRKRRSRSRFDDIQIHTTLPSVPPPSPPSPPLRPSGRLRALSTFGVGSHISLFGVEFQSEINGGSNTMLMVSNNPAAALQMHALQNFEPPPRRLQDLQGRRSQTPHSRNKQQRQPSLCTPNCFVTRTASPTNCRRQRRCCTHASLSHVKNTTIGGLNTMVFPGLNNGIMDSTQPAIDMTDRAAFQPPPDGAEKHESRRGTATLSPREMKPRSPRATRTPRRPNADAVAVFMATPCQREGSRTTQAPLRSAPANANTRFTPPPTGFAPPPQCQFSVHNVASGPLEEALAASISPMSNRSFTWTSGLPPEAYLLVKPGMNVQGPNRAIKVASRACLGVPAMLDVAMPVDAAAAAGTPTALGLLHKLSFGVGLGSPLAFCAASCTLPLLSLLSPLPALTSLSTRWTDLTPSTSPIFLPALLTFCALYPLLSRPFSNVCQRAWVLTGVAAGLMTCAAVPGMGRERRVRRMDGAAEAMGAVVAVNRVFQAYLTADMLIGTLCYRSQIGFLTGWVHHVVYIGITEIAIRKGWAHVFCLCAVMEVWVVFSILIPIPSLRFIFISLPFPLALGGLDMRTHTRRLGRTTPMRRATAAFALGGRSGAGASSPPPISSPSPSYSSYSLLTPTQLPTFLLSLSTLFLRARSNTLFVPTFIAMRIVFHVVLIWEFLGGGCIVLCSPYSFFCSSTSTPARVAGRDSFSTFWRVVIPASFVLGLTSVMHLDRDGRYAGGSAWMYGCGWTVRVESRSGAQCARRRFFFSLHSMTRLGEAALSRPCERLCAAGVYPLLQREPWGDRGQGGERGTRGGAAPTRLMLSQGGHGPRASSQRLGSGQAAVVTWRLRFLRSQLCERLRAACRRALLQSAAWSREQSRVGNAERGGEHPQSRKDEDGVIQTSVVGHGSYLCFGLRQDGDRDGRYQARLPSSNLVCASRGLKPSSPLPSSRSSPPCTRCGSAGVAGFVRRWRVRRKVEKAASVEVRVAGQKAGEVEGVSASGASTRAASVGSLGAASLTAHALRLWRVSRALLERGVGVGVGVGVAGLERWWPWPWGYSWIVAREAPPTDKAPHDDDGAEGERGVDCCFAANSDTRDAEQGRGVGITMRGAGTSAKVAWTHPFLPLLQSLKEDAARHTFINIADNTHDPKVVDRLIWWTLTVVLMYYPTGRRKHP
ncbi:hypothetical protein B0H13DRAFT_2284739 [Mycena leptocephala]|nr:hypothetical protein B0H13DRAFT_2284739 [Mycena leptocephala]